MATGRVFWDSGDQCVEIPEPFQFDADEVEISRIDETGALLLRAVKRDDADATAASAKAERKIHEIYQETQEFYREICPVLGEAALGYKILYGPIHSRPPLIIVGDQPGGGPEDAETGLHAGEREKWPERNEYAFKSWKLAKKLQKIWDGLFLDRCTGLNANFFRARSQADWQLALPRTIRLQAEAFCKDHMQSIIEILEPQSIVVIGLGTFDRIARDTAIEVQSDGTSERILVKRGKIGTYTALGVPHLIGSRISTPDFEKIAKTLRTLTRTD